MVTSKRAQDYETQRRAERSDAATGTVLTGINRVGNSGRPNRFKREPVAKPPKGWGFAT